MNNSSLAEMLRRCPPETHAAARDFRATRDPRHVAQIVRGVIERYVEPEFRPIVRNADDGMRLIEDLGIDSLTLMQIAVLVEDVLEVTTTDDQLRQLRTIGDVTALARHTVSARRDELLTTAGVPA